MDAKRGRGGRDEHGEGWGDRSRAHSDGASVEWELRDKTGITHTIAHPRSSWNGFNWQAPGWVYSRMTLWVDAFEVIKVLTGN